MPKKSTKSRSGRHTLRHKHKVIKKVREHHRKKDKEQKKLAKSGKKPREPKDPGIPADWPFKAELIKELEFKKQQILAKEQAKKDAKKLARAQRKAGVTPGEDTEMVATTSAQALQQSAEDRAEAFALGKRDRTDEASTSAPDGSRKAFFKDFRHVVQEADVILEVLDARDPLATRCLDIERHIRRAGGAKKIVLVLNKIDLVPKEVAERWLSYLREELPTLAFKCSQQKQKSRLGQRRLPKLKARRGAAPADAADGGDMRQALQQSAQASAAVSGAPAAGAEPLLQLLKSSSKADGLKASITVGVVGVPNVGKSSLINSLLRTQAVAVGNLPGITKIPQAVKLDKHITLMDSPGVVFAPQQSGDAAAEALRSYTKADTIADPVGAVSLIVAKCPARKLMAVYRVPSFQGPEGLLQLVASSRGRLLPGGVPDMEAAARLIIQDWHNGRIPYYTTPPPRASSGSAEGVQLVAEWGPEFDAANAATLQTLPDDEPADLHFEMPSAGAVAVDMDTAQDADGQEAGALGGVADLLPALQGPADSQPGSQVQQDRLLYTEPGQYNPHAARAAKLGAKKRQKRAGAGQPASEEFDFAEFGAGGKGGAGLAGLSGAVEMQDEAGGQSDSSDD